MRKIILTSLFFCLAITTVLAQIVTTNIATPNSNGLSNNQVNSFDVNTDGTILNNSASDGTAQLGATAVTGNNNITAGSEADLILLQVTGSSGSDLDGTIEVFGTEAGLIIANPNGITCAGCGFINASRVDLVTGSNYNSSTDSFNDIANTNIALIDNGLDASSVGILNIQAGSFTNTGGVLNSDTFALSVAGDFDYTNRGTITTNTLNLNVGGDFSNNDANRNFSWHANNTLIVLGSASFNVYDFFNRGIIDVANDFNVIAGDDFFNIQNARISANNFSVLTQDRFYNLHNAMISVNDFNVTAGSLFANRYDAKIGADNFNVTAGDDFFNTDNSTITANDLTISANSFVNSHPRGDGNIIADTFALSVTGDFDYGSEFLGNGNIKTTTLNLQVGGDFSYSDTNRNFSWHANNSLIVLGSASFNVYDFFNRGIIDVANDFNVIAGDDFFNIQNARISANNFSVLTQDRFYNLHNAMISVNDFNVTAGSLFANRYNANINANGFNVTAADNFYNTDNSTISANDLTISANSFVNNHTRGDGNINANTLTLLLIGDFDYTNRGTITTTTLNLNVGGDFSNNDVNNDFTWGANDTLTVLGSASFNVDDFYNRGEIDVVNDLTISANSFVNNHTDGDGNINADTLNLSLIGDFDYAKDFQNNGNIGATTLNLQVGGDFSNNDANNDFTWGANDSLTVLGTASVVAASFNNSGAIDIIGDLSIQVSGEASLDDNASIKARNLFFSAYNFYNQADFTITDSATFDIGLNFNNGFYLNGTIYDGGDIIANNFNVTAGGYFYNWLNATINADNFNVTVGDDFDNYNATINADNFNVTAGDDFYNFDSTINAASLNVAIADRFYNLHSAEITTNSFNLVAGGLFANRYNSNINADSFNATAGDSFYNTDNATINANDLTISANSFVNNHTRGDGNIIADKLILSLIKGFDYTSDYLNNGNIDAATLTILEDE